MDTSSGSILVLGRQPELGLAELERLFGSEAVHPVPHLAAAYSPAAGSTSPRLALLDVAPDAVAFARLGGSVKLARPLATLPTLNWPQIEAGLRKAALQSAKATPDGKLKIGLSFYGFEPGTMNPARANAAGLNLKKALRQTDRSVRIVPNKELQLNSAQVLHNHLTGELGREFLIIKSAPAKGRPGHTIIAQTVTEQDIDAYAARDQGRPKRDARVGMLPPKLAQIIVNLSGAKRGGTVWDPFCGTGVLLQEALLMGIDVYGSDIESRMIEYTEQNLAWLDTTYSTKYGATHGADSPSIWYDLQVGDATSVKFQNKHVMPLSAVACEGYLGQPFATFPSAERLTEVRSTCNLILKKFLQNIAPQLQPGTSLCLAVPAWQQRTGVFVHLPLVETGSHRQNTPASNGQPAHTRPLDHLEEMGYNRVSFKYVEPKDLIYARADQIVARELLVLIKK
jgi:hypothetical protein